MAGWGWADSYLRKFYAQDDESIIKASPILSLKELERRIQEQEVRLRKKELTLTKTKKDASAIVYERRELNVKLAVLRLERLKEQATRVKDDLEAQSQQLNAYADKIEQTLSHVQGKGDTQSIEHYQDELVDALRKSKLPKGMQGNTSQ